MKIFVLCLLLFCGFLVLDVHAQEVNPYERNIGFGIKGGLGLSNLSTGSNGNPLSSGYSSLSGPAVALFSEIKLSEIISVEPQLEYSSEGGKRDGLQAFPTPAIIAQYYPPPVPQYLYAKFNSTVKINYLMLPVLLKFGFDLGDSPLRVYAAGGPFVGLLLSAKQVSTGSSNVYTDKNGTTALPVGTQSFNQTTDLKSQLQSTNYGVEGNIGLSLKLDNVGQSFLSLEAGGNYGLQNVQKEAANGKNSTGAAVVTIGYSCFF